MKQYIVDAFSNTIFHGNQAAVCILEQWLPEDLMMNITKENNFSETAFALKEKNGYHLRWFTPGGEINLCGHATLGTAYVLFHFYEKEKTQLTFHTMSGDLYVSKEEDYITMNFPSYTCNKIEVTPLMTEVFGIQPKEAYLDRDLLLIYEEETIIHHMQPDFEKMKQLPGSGVSISAPGKDYDCVSRFFAPKLKVNEDPVTGSAHCMITPYWTKRLNKNTLNAYQASSRGGELFCHQENDRTFISGQVALFSESEIHVEQFKSSDHFR